MKRKFLLLFICLTTSLLIETYGQCSPQVHGMVFSFGVTDSITPMQFEPGPYYVCDNATLYYYGNNPDTVYLESSARLRVGYAFNLVVYMRSNSAFVMDTSTANWQTSRILEINYDPGFTTFLDTAGVQILSTMACPAMAFDYSQFPGGISPCSLPSAVESNKSTQEISVEIFPNPSFSSIQIRKKNPTQSEMKLELFDSQGKLFRSGVMEKEQVLWDVSSLPIGIYLLGVSSETGTEWHRLARH